MLNLYSLERRPERYAVIYIWKIFLPGSLRDLHCVDMDVFKTHLGRFLLEIPDELM